MVSHSRPVFNGHLARTGHPPVCCDRTESHRISRALVQDSFLSMAHTRLLVFRRLVLPHLLAMARASVYRKLRRTQHQLQLHVGYQMRLSLELAVQQEDRIRRVRPNINVTDSTCQWALTPTMIPTVWSRMRAILPQMHLSQWRSSTALTLAIDSRETEKYSARMSMDLDKIASN